MRKQLLSLIIFCVLTIPLSAQFSPVSPSDFYMLPKQKQVPQAPTFPAGQYIEKGELRRKSLDNGEDWRYNKERDVWWRHVPTSQGFLVPRMSFQPFIQRLKNDCPDGAST